jgi:hypothetical protein
VFAQHERNRSFKKVRLKRYLSLHKIKQRKCKSEGAIITKCPPFLKPHPLPAMLNDPTIGTFKSIIAAKKAFK